MTKFIAIVALAVTAGYAFSCDQTWLGMALSAAASVLVMTSLGGEEDDRTYFERQSSTIR